MTITTGQGDGCGDVGGGGQEGNTTLSLSSSSSLPSSSLPSSSSSSLLLFLSRARATRDQKRKDMEDLFQRFTWIQKEMKRLEVELIQLDEQIDLCEEQQQQEMHQQHKQQEAKKTESTIKQEEEDDKERIGECMTLPSRHVATAVAETNLSSLHNRGVGVGVAPAATEHCDDSFVCDPPPHPNMKNKNHDTDNHCCVANQQPLQTRNDCTKQPQQQAQQSQPPLGGATTSTSTTTTTSSVVTNFFDPPQGQESKQLSLPRPQHTQLHSSPCPTTTTTSQIDNKENKRKHQHHEPENTSVIEQEEEEEDTIIEVLEQEKDDNPFRPTDTLFHPPPTVGAVVAAASSPPPPPPEPIVLEHDDDDENDVNNKNNQGDPGTTTTTPQRPYPWTAPLLDLLQHTFGIASYREQQQEIINATLQGQNAFVLMRTGGGKSLTYQLPAIYEGRHHQYRYSSSSSSSSTSSPPLSTNKITVVISPLLSLIQDQEEQLNAIVPGSATSFTSGLSGGSSEHARRWNLVRNPNAGICLILVTPEKVHKSTKLRTELQKLYIQGRLGRFVIDECHCACQWGCDFRPDYAQLGILKRHFPTIPVLAVTATASTRVRQDVVQILGIAQNYQFFRSTAHRPNLQYSIRSKQGENNDVVLHDMAEWIQQHYPFVPQDNNKRKKKNNNSKDDNDNDDKNESSASGIIYTLSRKDANTVAQKLQDVYGISARPYHSDVSPTRKLTIHREWMSNQIQVVVATIAFGLGFNKPNVRFVLHHCISKTLEAYYQESGRAGRDGKPAHCVLYYSPRDVIRMRTLVHETHRGEENLMPMVRYAQASGNDAVCKAIILDNLGEPNAPNPVQVQKNNDGQTTETRDVGLHGQIVARLVQDAAQDGCNVTMSMLVKQWRSTGASNKNNNKKKTGNPTPQYVLDHPPAKDKLSVDECERIIIALLVEQVLCFHIHWTSYSAVAYLRLAAPRGHQLLQSSRQPKMIVRFPIRHVMDKAAVVKKKKTGPKSVSNGDGTWLETRPKTAVAPSKKTKKTAAAATTTKAAAATGGSRKRKATLQPSKKKATRKRAAVASNKKTNTTRMTTATNTAASNSRKVARVSNEMEVIELFSDDDDNVDIREQSTRSQSLSDSLWNMDEDDNDDDNESAEFEFGNDDDDEED